MIRISSPVKEYKEDVGYYHDGYMRSFGGDDMLKESSGHATTSRDD